MKKAEILKFYLNYRLYLFPAIVALSSLILIILVIYPVAVKLITNSKVEGEILSKSKFLETKAQALDSLDQVDLDRKVNFALGSLPTDNDFVSDFGSVDSPLPGLSEKDDEVIAKLAKGDTAASTPTTQLGPRGKENPFE